MALFIKELYLISPGETQCQYEIKYVLVETQIIENQRQIVLRKRLQRKHTCDGLKTPSRKKRVCKSKKETHTPTEKCIKLFRDKIQIGPVYICVICNRSLYRKTVKVFIRNKYFADIVDKLDNDIRSFDHEKCICLTCAKSLIKNKVPCQAVVNGLDIDNAPDFLRILNKLKIFLILKRLLFKKIVVMGKGQYPKIKGAICNIPVNVTDAVDVLPRSSHSSGILLVKLKKKIEFKGHVYFEPVSPEKVRSALLYLKVNNPLYKDVVINMDTIPQELLNFDEDEQIDIEMEQALDCTEIETERNPLDEFRQASTESCAVPNISQAESLFEFAPGEGKSPSCVITDDHCEELAFPHYFSKGYKRKRAVKLSPVRYFNQRLLTKY